MSVSIERVLRQSADLQHARSLADLIQVTGVAVRALANYSTAWVGWFDPDDPSMVRLLIATPTLQETIWESSPLIPRAGDAMFDEIAEGRRPVVVVDARTDPRTNKEMVELYGNLTIINVPIILGGSVKGSLGMGTSKGEPPRAPTDDELEALVLFASQLAPAFDRVQALNAQRKAEQERVAVELERRALEKHLESVQRVELMGVLAAGVAHDLNNLLGVAFSSLDVLDEQKLGPDAGVVGDARNALERMRDITRQLLQLGRAQSGPRRLDLNEKVTSTVALVRPSIPRSIMLVHEHQGTPYVDGDPVQLEQAIANLVINARDAIGAKGRIDLRVDELVLDEVAARKLRGRAGRFARVRVSDTGPGIPPELHARVFDPLFTTKAMGTGLGLAVVSRVMQQHQGFVRVESEPGHGASFELYLPAR